MDQPITQTTVVGDDRPLCSAGHAPVRRPGAVRRTSTIDVSWPQGRKGSIRLEGRARDIRSTDDLALVVLGEDRLLMVLDPSRTIIELETSPPRAGAAQLVGQRGRLRSAVQSALPDEVTRHTPLYLLLDDVAGASLVSTWAWSHWTDDWMGKSDAGYDPAEFARVMAGKVNICAGFIAGGTAASAGGNHRASGGAPTCGLRNPADPDGWHAFGDQSDVGFRRARRIDVWPEDGTIIIDAAFQDSASTPEGIRQVVHEYSLSVRLDSASLRVDAVSATPHVLPYKECVAARDALDCLVGEPVSRLREVVLDRLRGPAGCTHLNDALRVLADVPALVCALSEQG